MNNQPTPPNHDPDHPEVISTTDARSGTTGNKVRYVLILSVIIAVISLLAVYVISPKGTQEGATTAPGPK